MMLQKKIFSVVAILLIVCAFFAAGYLIDRTQSLYLISIAAASFFSFYILTTNKAIDLKALLFFAVFCRVIFMFSIPVLSDDYFRFLWDGHLINDGINPFLALPSSLKTSPELVDKQLMGFLFTHMNSPDYFSVYPTVMQAIFSFATWLYPDSIMGPVILFHFVIILGEVGTLFLGIKILRLLQLPERNILWYALNPLVIIELSGNLHFEALMILFLAAAVFLLLKNKPIGSGICLGFAVGVKLLPLIFLPFVFKAFRRNKRLAFVISCLITMALLFSYFFSKVFVNHFSQSVALYFHKFEFNGSVYKILRWAGYVITANNIIWVLGVALPIIVLCITGWLYFRQKYEAPMPAIRYLFLSLTAFFVMASIVHPWYLTTLIFLNIFLSYRFIFIWSATIFLSYFAYHQHPYEESTWISFAEYLPVFILLIIETRKAAMASFLNRLPKIQL